ncbi:MAG: MFS transporter [Bacteroidetes bacterium]|jgi:MFS family permease|nr:MFS transporter [Bacteroidota bacterium]
MDSSNDRSIVGLTMIAHAMVHTYELSIPILMTLWLEEFALSKAVLGGIVAAGYGLFGLGAVPGGVLADRFGSKRLIMGCLAGMGGAFLLLSTAQGLWMITAALVLWGAAASVYHPAGLALISKGVVRRGRAFAWHGMAGNIGIALGPLATTVALIAFDWRTVSLLLVAPAVVALVIAARLRFDEHAGLDAHEQAAAQGTADWSTLLARSRRLLVPSFLIVFGIVMLSGLYYRGALTFLPELLGTMATLPAMAFGDLTLESGRYVYVGLLLIGVFGQYVGGWLTERVALERGIGWTFVALALIAALYWPAANAGLGPLLAISALLGFFLFVAQPLYQATVAEYSPAEARGLSYGFTYLGVFGVGALGAALTGAVLDLFSPAAMFGVLAVLAGMGAFLGFRLTQRAAVARS